MDEEKHFDFTEVPGKKLDTKLAINDGEPLISIATAYYNCKDYILETAYSILNQTFPYWEWNIINDGSTEKGTDDVLDKISKLDNRIHVFNQENQGRLKARDNAVAKAKCDLVFIIDADDTIDKTYLETAYFSMMKNPEATWAYCNTVTFGEDEFLWKKIFNSETEKKENLLSVCALIKKQAILDVGGYSAVDENVHEDWHLWLRMLEKCMYPIRMNYYGFWYRYKKTGSILNSIKGNKQKQKHAMDEINKQARKIKNKVGAIQYPMTADFNYDSYPEQIEWNRKPIKDDKKTNLLFIFPWLRLGGADKFNLDLISMLDQDKYDITIVTTEPCEYVWRQKFEKYATVFDLTSFLHRRDWAGFIDYIIRSRNINLVFQSQSYYGYYVIPWLKALHSTIPFVDYLHAENWDWRNGEYPRDSTAIANLLDRTYTCTKHLKSEMTDKMGRVTDNVRPVYIGIDTNEFEPSKVKISDDDTLEKIERKRKNQKKILFCCRISDEKRPIVALKILSKLKSLGKNYCLYVVGDGDSFNKMRRQATKLEILDNIEFFGAKDNVKPFYKACDVTLICSEREGLTLTTYESMSMKTPVVSPDVGGQSELIDNDCGRLIKPKISKEIEKYAEAIIDIIENNDYKNICNNCRAKIEKDFKIGTMAKTIESEISNLAKNGSAAGLNANENIEMYAQYLVLYNQLNPVCYFPEEAGAGIDTAYYNAEEQRIKDELWKNPAYRSFIKVLQKTGIIKLAKKTGLNEKIKKTIVKRKIK